MKRFIGIVALLGTLIAAPASAQTTQATLSGITCPGAGCLEVTVSATGQMALQLGPGFVGTYVFEKTVDQLVWFPWTLTSASGAAVTFTTAPGIFNGVTEGSAKYRVRASLLWSGSSLATFIFVQSGSGNFGARYLLQQTDDTLVNSQSIGALTTGLMKNTITAGAVPYGTVSTAVAGTDYLAPNGVGTGLSGIGLLTNPLSQFAATSSAQLAATVSDETGTGLAVFGTSPTITTPTINNGTINSPTVVTPTIQKIANLTTNGIVTTTGSDGTLTVVPPNGIWGTITGTLSNQTDLQAALDAKQPLDADLTSIAALTTTSFGRSFLALADAAAARTLTGSVIGTNVEAWDADLDAVAALATTSNGRGFLTLTDAAAGRTYLGLVIGTNVQAYSSVLDTFVSNGSNFYLNRANHTGTQAWSTITSTPTSLSGYGITDAWALASRNTDTAASVVSAPSVLFTGAIYTGGSATTTRPFMLFEASGTTAGTHWEPNGTMLGINMPSNNGMALTVLANNSYSLSILANGCLQWQEDTSMRLCPSFGNRIALASKMNFAIEESGYFSFSRFFGWHNGGADALYGLFNSGNSQTTGLSVVYGSNIGTTPAYSAVGLQHVERVVAGGNCNGAKTANFQIETSSTGNWYSYTITGSSCAITLSNAAAGGHYYLVFTVDGTGGYTAPTWSTTVKWDGGVAPTFTMTANKINVVELWFDGTNYIGKGIVIGG